jgi:hypothetical protein
VVWCFNNHNHNHYNSFRVQKVHMGLRTTIRRTKIQGCYATSSLVIFNNGIKLNFNKTILRKILLTPRARIARRIV